MKIVNPSLRLIPLHLINIILLLTINLKAQIGWSEPVPIDSTRQFYWPLIAVSPQGQIATLGFGGLLYISDDNGKSFQLKYEFKPPVDYYRVFTPLGLAYDSNSVLWIYLVWDECYDETCEIPVQPIRQIYLSRSTDGGNTFEHVLKFNGYFSLNNYGPANPALFIEDDNTIHFLRDSAWYNGNFTEFYLIYSKVPQSDFTKRIEVPLPTTPDSLEIDATKFNIPNNGYPVVVQKAHVRNRTLQQYILFTKLKTNNEFTEYSFIDSWNLGSIEIKIFSKDSSELYLNYSFENLSNGKVYYYTAHSENNGDTLGYKREISEEVFYINLTSPNYFYAIDYSYRKKGMMYYKFKNLFSEPLDSAYLGYFIYSSVYLDKHNGKNVILTNSQNKSFFIGKDLVTFIKIDDVLHKNNSNEIGLTVNPNPFNNTVIISFTLPDQEMVKIILYDVIGKKVKEIQDYPGLTGENKVTFETGSLTSGVYIVNLQIKNAVYTIKTLLLK